MIYARITAAPRGTIGAEAATHAVTTHAYIAVLRTLNTQIRICQTSWKTRAGSGVVPLFWAKNFRSDAPSIAVR